MKVIHINRSIFLFVNTIVFNGCSSTRSNVIDSDMASISILVDYHWINHGEWLGDGIVITDDGSILSDPWGAPYEINKKGANGYTIKSLGADGSDCTSDDIIRFKKIETAIP